MLELLSLAIDAELYSKQFYSWSLLFIFYQADL